LTGDIPVYIIYYGSGHLAGDNAKLEYFLTNIGDAPIWKVVYQYGGGRPLKSLFKVSVPCDAQCTNMSLCNSCSVIQHDEGIILDRLFSTARLPANQKAIYILMLGSNVIYTFKDQTASLTSFTGTMGQSQLAGK
jgi:hypothetical protein